MLIVPPPNQKLIAWSRPQQSEEISPGGMRGTITHDRMQVLTMAPLTPFHR